MNIFVLSKDPMAAAKMLCDKHISKMVVESAQMLSTAHRIADGDAHPDLYKVTHKNHPCTRWVMESKQNYRWLYYHFCGIAKEFEFRRKKQHLTFIKLGMILANEPKNIPDGPRTEFVQAFKAYPECKIEGDAVQSYRNYYHMKSFAKWDWGREAPFWWKGHENADIHAA